jgi:DNA repair protein RadC
MRQQRINRFYVKKETTTLRLQIAQPLDAAAIMKMLFADAAQEHFVVFHLGVASKVLGYEVVAQGACNTVQVSPADVFRGAIVGGASSIVIAHNHPSGDPTPSIEDRAATERLRAAADLLGIKLLDHVIVGGDAHYSFAERECWGPTVLAIASPLTERRLSSRVSKPARMTKSIRASQVALASKTSLA